MAKTTEKGNSIIDELQDEPSKIDVLIFVILAFAVMITRNPDSKRLLRYLRLSRRITPSQPKPKQATLFYIINLCWAEGAITTKDASSILKLFKDAAFSKKEGDGFRLTIFQGVRDRFFARLRKQKNVSFLANQIMTALKGEVDSEVAYPALMRFYRTHKPIFKEMDFFYLLRIHFLRYSPTEKKGVVDIPDTKYDDDGDAQSTAFLDSVSGTDDDDIDVAALVSAYLGSLQNKKTPLSVFSELGQSRGKKKYARICSENIGLITEFFEADASVLPKPVMDAYTDIVNEIFRENLLLVGAMKSDTSFLIIASAYRDAFTSPPQNMQDMILRFLQVVDRGVSAPTTIKIYRIFNNIVPLKFIPQTYPYLIWQKSEKPIYDLHKALYTKTLLEVVKLLPNGKYRKRIEKTSYQAFLYKIKELGEKVADENFISAYQFLVENENEDWAKDKNVLRLKSAMATRMPIGFIGNVDDKTRFIARVNNSIFNNLPKLSSVAEVTKALEGGVPEVMEVANTIYEAAGDEPRAWVWLSESKFDERVLVLAPFVDLSSWGALLSKKPFIEYVMERWRDRAKIFSKSVTGAHDIMPKLTKSLYGASITLPKTIAGLRPLHTTLLSKDPKIIKTYSDTISNSVKEASFYDLLGLAILMNKVFGESASPKSFSRIRVFRFDTLDKGMIKKMIQVFSEVYSLPQFMDELPDNMKAYVLGAGLPVPVKDMSQLPSKYLDQVYSARSDNSAILYAVGNPRTFHDIHDDAVSAFLRGDVNIMEKKLSYTQKGVPGIPESFSTNGKKDAMAWDDFRDGIAAYLIFRLVGDGIFSQDGMHPEIEAAVTNYVLKKAGPDEIVKIGAWAIEKGEPSLIPADVWDKFVKTAEDINTTLVVNRDGETLGEYIDESIRFKAYFSFGSEDAIRRNFVQALSESGQGSLQARFGITSSSSKLSKNKMEKIIGFMLTQAIVNSGNKSGRNIKKIISEIEKFSGGLEPQLSRHSQAYSLELTQTLMAGDDAEDKVNAYFGAVKGGAENSFIVGDFVRTHSIKGAAQAVILSEDNPLPVSRGIASDPDRVMGYLVSNSSKTTGFFIDPSLLVPKENEKPFNVITRVSETAVKDYAVPPPRIEEVTDTSDELELATIDLNVNYNRLRHGDIIAKVLKRWQGTANENEAEVRSWVRSRGSALMLKPAFHGTGTLAANMILRYWFKTSEKFIKAGRALGDGVYFASNIDKSLQYVGDNSYGRRQGTKGYLLKCRIFFKDKGKDYRDATGKGWVSPEWAVFDPWRQILIDEIYFVEIGHRSHLFDIAQKHGVKLGKGMGKKVAGPGPAVL